MENLDRRSALVLGASFFVPLVSLSRPAEAAMYPADAGKEAVPGVRQVDLGKWPIDLPNLDEGDDARIETTFERTCQWLPI